MAEKKQTKKTSAGSSAKRSDAKNQKTSENKKVRENIKELKKQQGRENTLVYQIAPFLLVFCAIFLIICFAIPENMGFLKYLVKFFKGLFGSAMWAIPFCTAVYGLLWRKDYAEYRAFRKLVWHFGIVSSIAALVHIAKFSASESFNPVTLYTGGIDGTAAGVIGGFLGTALYKLAGWGSAIIGAFLLAAFVILSLQGVLMDGIMFIRDFVRNRVYQVNVERQRRLEENVANQKRTKQQEIAKANERRSRIVAMSFCEPRS